MSWSVGILAAKAVLDGVVAIIEAASHHPTQAFLFFTFVLVDIASIGVLVK